MAETEDQLKRMVMTFRVSELQMLLGYAGKNKTGRKNELQSRALEIVRLRNPTIQQKIKELYKSIQLEMSFGDRSQTTAGAPTATLHAAQKVSLGLGSIPGYSQTGASHLAPSHSTRYSSAATTAAATTLGGGVVYPTLAAAAHGSSYPINPDVKLKNLPFYDVLGELLKPSTLAPQGSGRYQESSFTFSLTPQQANKIANSRDLRPGRQDYSIQVQMRFCLLETTCEQDDNFPPNIAVKINDKMCPLPSPIPTNKPGVEPKRPSRPVNVTTLCRISPTVTNRIQVSWASEYGRCYVISVYLVQKLTSDDLLQRLKNRGVKIADFTRSLIKQKLQEDADCEIATTSLRCSLMCPLGKMRMLLPCRAHTCGHLQCFDASLYLQMNERKPTWTCPVCDKPAVYGNLVIDGYFQEVLCAATNCNEVTLHKDGTWTPLIPKKEKEPAAEKVNKSAAVAVETLSDDSEDEAKEPEEASIVEEVNGRKRASVEPEIITLTDSEEEDDSHQPPAPKRPSTTTGSAGAGNNTAGASGETTPHGSDGTKSNDSWCIGEVDHGKRLVFRKSLSSSSNGTGLLAPVVGASSGPTFTPPSSGSVSPQVICLDSPASSPSPPPRRSTAAAEPATVTMVPSQTSSSSTATSPSVSTPSVTVTSTSSSSDVCRQVLTAVTTAVGSTAVLNNGGSSTPLSALQGSCALAGSSSRSGSGSPVPAATITPIAPPCNTSPFIPSATTTESLSAANPFSLPATSVASSASSSITNPSLLGAPPTYPLPAALQNLFNPLGMIPPTSMPSSLPFRPGDRYV